LFFVTVRRQNARAMKTALCLIFASCFAVLVRAADPSPLTEVRIKETAARQYFCAKKELKLPQMSEFAMQIIPQLAQKATELKLGQGGPLMMTYFDFHGDPEQTFTAEIGLPIQKEDVQNAGTFYVRKAPKFKCAAAIFQGPLSRIGEAWQSFVSDAMTKGEPTGESRELYLYWEGHDSPNNIIELQLGLK
jgi:effector-binding domain-containing protein